MYVIYIKKWQKQKEKERELKWDPTSRWRGEWNTLFSHSTRFKNFEEKSKETMSANGRLGALQMVSSRLGALQMVLELDSGWCASKKTEFRRGVDTRWVMCQQGDWASKRGGHETMCQQRRWALKGVDWGRVPHRLDKGTSTDEDTGP